MLNQKHSSFEVAVYLSKRMEDGEFKSQCELSKSTGISQGTVSKMIKAVSILNYEFISEMFPERKKIPVKLAYALSSLLKKKESFNIIKGEAEIIKQESLDRKFSFSYASVIERLINKTKPQQDPTLPLALLTIKNKRIVTCYKDKFGRFNLIVDPGQNHNTYEYIQEVCVKAIKKYISTLSET